MKTASPLPNKYKSIIIIIIIIIINIKILFIYTYNIYTSLSPLHD